MSKQSAERDAEILVATDADLDLDELAKYAADVPMDDLDWSG